MPQTGPRTRPPGGRARGSRRSGRSAPRPPQRRRRAPKPRATPGRHRHVPGCRHGSQAGSSKLLRSLDSRPRKSVFSRTVSKVSLLYAAREDMSTNGEESGFTAAQPSLLRAINERTILELVRRAGVTSRGDIARESGLSKPTVSLALNGLVAAGLVEEVGRARGGKGPSAVLYRLNPQAGWVVGIDVGRRYVRAAVADITGSLVARRDERANSRSAAAMVEQIGEVAHQVVGDAGIRWGHVTHATVGHPGVLDPDRGLLAHAPNLPGWGRQGLVEAIRRRLGTMVSFENDVNLAALGERADGLGRDVENFVFLSVGTGIGAGIIVGGRLYRGAGGAAGEVAYLPVGPGEPRDPAHRRRGMLEDSTAAAGIVEHARSLGMTSARTPKAVFTAARRGDELAMRVVQAEAERIALAVATLAPVLDPQLVILGGGIGMDGDLLLEPIERELRAISPCEPRIAVSELGDEAVLHGAVSTALSAAQQQVFTRAPDGGRREIVV